MIFFKIILFLIFCIYYKYKIKLNRATLNIGLSSERHSQWMEPNRHRGLKPALSRFYRLVMVFGLRCCVSPAGYFPCFPIRLGHRRCFLLDTNACQFDKFRAYWGVCGNCGWHQQLISMVASVLGRVNLRWRISTDRVADDVFKVVRAGENR